MSQWMSLATAWDWEPSIVLGCAALVGAYLWGTRMRPGWRLWPFLSGVLVLALALLSPLDVLSDEYLFTAHMIQHLLLILVVPPLLLAGFDQEVLRRLLRYRVAAAAERVFGWPPLAWFLGTGTLILWHVPVFYNGALADEDIHVLEHLDFLVTSCMFWWPVTTPLPERRLGLLASFAYLISGAAANAALAVFIAAGPLGLYPAYFSPEDSLGILPLIRDGWGFSPADDQRYGGFVMLVAGTPAFIVAMLRVLVWHSVPRPESTAVERGS